MKVKFIEKRKNKWKLEIKGGSHGFLNLLKEKAWDAKAKQASYMIEHPYLTEPKIIIRAENPKNVLIKAAKLITEESKLFLKLFKKAL